MRSTLTSYRFFIFLILQGSFNFALLVAFNYIPYFHIIKSIDADTAIKASFYFT